MDRFETMIGNVEMAPTDLPGLICIQCELFSSFGGSESFESRVFTVNDICTCEATKHDNPEHAGIP